MDVVSDHGGSSLVGEQSIAILLTSECQCHPMYLRQAWNCGPCTSQAYRLVREFPSS